MKKVSIFCLCLAAVCSTMAQQPLKTKNSQGLQIKNVREIKVRERNNDVMDVKQKVQQYATVKLTSDLSHLTQKEKQLLGIFIDVAQIMDDIYWKQVFGEKRRVFELKDKNLVDFALINYGVWDRMDNNKPFVVIHPAKTPGLNFYPEDMTKEEFTALNDPKKDSPYTVIRRDNKGKLYVRGYYEEYKEDLDRAISLLRKAVTLCEDKGMKTYLTERIKALQTNDYYKSDMAWMDMKNSNLDFVVGPIENYDDEVFGLKTSFEAFVLVKDPEWSKSLTKYTALLPELQRGLPCAEEFKREVPGTESDLNVYDVVYYAGDCNAAGKTIAINLPNDERVQLKKGSRRLQLKNAMKAKFDAIVVPIAKRVMNPRQFSLVNFDAFFSNVMFHEVAHGLGIKNTITGKGPVRTALQGEYSAYEEAKADVLGLYMVIELIKRGEITNLKEEQAMATYMAGLLRSIRFGSAEAHGRANLMCYNFFRDHGAFTIDEKGLYVIDFKKMKEAIMQWSAFIIELEGRGDYQFAVEYGRKNAVIDNQLQEKLDVINNSGIPVDVVFEQGKNVLGL